MKRPLLVLCAVSGSFLISSCGDSTDVSAPIEGLALSTDSALGWAGDEASFVASRVTAGGGEQWFDALTWRLTDPTVARIARATDSSVTLELLSSGEVLVVGAVDGFADSLVLRVREEGEVLGFRAWAAEAAINTPAFGDDGSIYLVRRQPGALVALNLDLSVRWERPLALGGIMTPAVAIDGTIFATSLGGYTAAFSLDGTVLWADSNFGSGHTAPALAGDGEVYVAGHGASTISDWGVKRYSASGVELQRFSNLGRAILAPPLIVQDSVIITVDSDASALARTRRGDTLWIERLPSMARYFAPSVGANGRDVYVPTNNRLITFDAFTGTVRWTWLSPGGAGALLAPLVDAEGNIYIQTNNTLVALNPDGTSRWRADSLGGDHNSNSGGGGAITFGGVIYVNCQLDLCAVNTADGSVRWRKSLPVPGRPGSISVLPDSSIVFVTLTSGTDSSYVVRLRGRYPLARRVWPVDGGGLGRWRRKRR